MPQSTALEVNLADSRVEVFLDPKYETLLKITSGYHGLSQGLEALLREVCHPYKNWKYIVAETRRFALQNFYLFKEHPSGPAGVQLITDIFLDAMAAAKPGRLQSEAIDNLLVYLQQIIKESDHNLARFHNPLNYAFNRLAQLSADTFFLVVRSYYDVSRLVRDYCRTSGPDAELRSARGLLQRYLKETYVYWLSEPDPLVWFTNEVNGISENEVATLFKSVTHNRFRECREILDMAQVAGKDAAESAWNSVVALPSFRDIVSAYESVPRDLAKTGERAGLGDLWLLIFLLFIMNITGLASIHERTLRDINRTMARLIGRETPARARSLMAKTFRILEHSARQYPATALNLVLNMGQAVYKTDDSDTVEFFITSAVGLGFQTPDLGGVSDNWEVRSNAAHVQNIQTWLQLIEQNPRWSKKLLSSLIINLAVSGVFIKDTDLFPRNITELLNSDIRPVFNLVKQLCRLFPSYFNEIGAEGRLRDVSTRVDEVRHRRDPLIHFLRKQAHVESSPQTVALIEAIFEFWLSRNKEPLRPLVPPAIFGQVMESGPEVDGMHQLMTELRVAGLIRKGSDLLTIPEAVLAEKLRALNLPDIGPEDRERLGLAQALYQMLYQKYHTDLSGLRDYIEQLSSAFVPDPGRLKGALSHMDLSAKLTGLLDYLEILKERILSPAVYEVQEDIYIKRHIAVDIPSMYGSYHEAKFDALGLTFRLEALINTLFQELIDALDLTLVTRATFIRILECLQLFDRALKLDGINSPEMERQLDLLHHSIRIRGFSLTQYLDIFRGMSQVVSNVVNDYFNNVHHQQMVPIMGRLSTTRILPKYLPGHNQIEPRALLHRVSEIFLRDRIATSLGLQQLDQFVSRAQKVIFQQEHELGEDQVRRLLNYDPDKAFTPIHPVNPEMADVIHLGAKGLNLTKLLTLGLPVPPGFIISTETFRCQDVIDGYRPARDHFRARLGKMMTWLESQSGRKFGDPTNPLLLSVRSGSSISQPGMLNTFLNVGLNEEIARGMAAKANGGAWFAWDCYRRFLQSFGMASGLARNDFDALMLEAKQNYGLAYKRMFSGEQMKNLAMTYKTFVLDHGLPIVSDPFEQLYMAIKGVFDSWTAPRARTYRQIMGISSDWGTAVTIQAMVFGNLSERAGSGVIFTHNPRWSGDKLMLWGDFTVANQGEDVVSGLVETMPITEQQAQIENRTNSPTLEAHFPEIYRELREFAKSLIYNWGYNPQEMEFTFEGPRRTDLFFLQTRDLVLRERKETQGFDPARIPSGAFLGYGIGVSGGAMSGRLIFTSEEIRHWREEEPQTALILVRGDTVPDDIREISEADGLLTARGGSTSHAAIVAYRLNKTCVVGCAEMICDETKLTCTIGGRKLVSGDWLSIDGQGGAIYEGQII